MKGSKEMGIIFILCVCLLIAAVAIYLLSEETQAKKYVKQIESLQTEFSKYVTKEELAKLDIGAFRVMATEAKMSVKSATDQCLGLVNDRMKKSDADFLELKTRVENMQMQVNKQHNSSREPAAKIIHATHTHTYAKPIEVDLNYPESAPKVKPKGRGQKSLLERSMR